jgi:hypothetical protein
VACGEWVKYFNLGARWLPTPTSISVQTAPRILPLNSTVSCLIDLDTKWWNLDLVLAIFNEEEARVISNILLSTALPPDRLEWQGTSNGLISVHSAYHLGKELHQRSLGACSNFGKEVDSWCVIWNLKVPSTVKVFMWRTCHDILPTMVNLFKRKVVKTPLCPCCKLEEETIIHACFVVMFGPKGCLGLWAEIFSKILFLGSYFRGNS